jgi:endonuclease YncB( thermonuclease family)
MLDKLYYYKANITAVYDGDTCTADIDLGLHTIRKGEKIRLSRINAPEVRGVQRQQGLISRDFIRNLILDKEVLIQTLKDKKGKYGRFLGEIWLINEDGSLSNVNDLMVSSDFAEYKEY